MVLWYSVMVKVTMQDLVQQVGKANPQKRKNESKYFIHP